MTLCPNSSIITKYLNVSYVEHHGTAAGLLLRSCRSGLSHLAPVSSMKGRSSKGQVMQSRCANGLVVFPSSLKSAGDARNAVKPSEAPSFPLLQMVFPMLYVALACSTCSQPPLMCCGSSAQLWTSFAGAMLTLTSNTQRGDPLAVKAAMVKQTTVESHCD